MEPRNNFSQVNVHSIREKIGSKKELYDFLTQECFAYLPKFSCTNIYFFKSIINGEKNYLKRNEVIMSAVPQIEGLTADDFINFAQKHQNILAFLPDQCDWIHLDKKWICDVLMSLDKDGIARMIQEAKEIRSEKFNKKQDLLVSMRPEFAEALNKSLQYSQQKGRSAFLLKSSSQRKRKQREIEEVKQEEQLLSKSKQKYLEQNKRVREELNSLQDQVDELSEYKNLVVHLHQNGIINEDGNLLIQPPEYQDQMQ